MRCSKCNYPNVEGATICVQCGASLQSNVVPAKTVIEPGGIENTATDSKTKCPRCGYILSTNVATCPHCGASIANQVKIARQPTTPGILVDIDLTGGNSEKHHSDSTPKSEVTFEKPDPALQNKPELQSPSKGSDYKGTVNPYVQQYLNIPEFLLHPIARENEKNTPKDITLSGDEVTLNRGNLEPNNMTITSKAQAVISNENGKWYIKDESALKTTFVRVNGATELKEGDIILMGDRLFEFHAL